MSAEIGIETLNEPPKYDNGLGLVRPPRKTDCIAQVGMDCPVAERYGVCRKNEHHLYFSARMYREKGELHQSFANHPFNRQRIAMCRHNSAYKHSIHRLFEGVDPPAHDVMEGFLYEADGLINLQEAVQNACRTGQQLGTTELEGRGNVPGAWHSSIITDLSQFEEAYPEIVGSFEVLPAPLVGRCMYAMKQQRQSAVDDLRRSIATESTGRLPTRA